MFKDNDQFFPTPKELVFKMLDKVNEIRRIKYVLEPSAGKGDIIEAYKEYYNKQFSNKFWSDEKAEKNLVFDAIEPDENLSNLLRGKGINIIHDDFLTYEPQRFYDLIIMNPPFEQGDRHLLKAIKEIQQRIGGEIVCLLNAETLKNPYTNTRKELIQLIKQYTGEVEYIQNAFSCAERQTDVETALIYINVPMKKDDTIFEKHFKRDNPDINVDNFQSIIPQMSKLQQLVFECDMVKKSTIELFKEKMRINKLLNGFGVSSEICICDNSSTPKALSVNDFIDKTNLQYWNKFIEETDFKKKLPSKLRDNFNYNMEKQRNISFTMENIHYFYEELIKSIPKSYEETVAKVFDELTYKGYYSDTMWNSNIYLYNGWKSNSCYKINKKSIIRYYGSYLYRIPDTLKDLNIIFNNIKGVQYDIDNREVIDAIKRCDKNIDTEHFYLSSFKKGTIHIVYKDKRALEIFNILSGKGKAWLPPDFMSTSSKNMTEEDKKLIIDFGLTFEEYDLLAISNSNNNYLRLE